MFQKAIDRRLQNFVNVNQSAILRGTAVYNNVNQRLQVRDGYLDNSDVYSIVRRIAKTAATVPIQVYKVVDKKAFKEYQRLTEQKNYSPQHQLKRHIVKAKAIQPVEDDNELQKLIDNPNPVYDKTEFLEGVYIFRLLTGNSYVYAPSLDLGVNKGKPYELWLLPSQYTQPIVTNTIPKEITGYQLNIAEIVPFTKEEVIHSRYFNPNYTWDGQELIGLSPLQAGRKILQRSSDETDYSVAAFQNAGISGIVSNENATELKTETAGKLKSDFYSEASGKSNARKLLFTAGKINYTAIGLGPVDMDIINSEVRTFKRLCNVYGVSDVLFNNSDASTESNVQEMIKQLYTNAVLPEVMAYVAALNNTIVKKFNTNGATYFVDCDISEITVLQEDMKRLAEVFNSLPIMVPNYILEATGFGKQEDPLLDKVYIKQGYTPIDEMGLIKDIPMPTNGR